MSVAASLECARTSARSRRNRVLDGATLAYPRARSSGVRGNGAMLRARVVTQTVNQPRGTTCASNRKRTSLRFSLIAVLVTSAVLSACSNHDSIAVGRPVPRERSRRRTTTTPGSEPLAHRARIIGFSVRGVPLVAIGLGAPNAPRTIVVVGCIHGDEPAGIAIARALERQPIPPSRTLWVIEDLNPDGVAAHTRQNAHGVDLNRNFPDNWKSLDPLGGEQYSGTGPLSEPETRAAAGFLTDVRPSLTIWFHQHAALVDESGGDPSIEAQFARAIGLPLARLTRYPGSATTWENHYFVGSTAFVVELPAGTASPTMIRRAVNAILASPAKATT